MNASQVWIVVLNYNGLEDTRRCLQSLMRQIGPPPPVLVVDNASTVNPEPVLAPDFPTVRFLRTPSNLGYAGGNNAGIRHALANGAEAVIILNNDTVVSPHLTGQLLAAATAHPELGVIGPVIYHLDRPMEVQTDGVRFNTPVEAGFFGRHEVPLGGPPQVERVDIVNGCCMWVRREVFLRVGLIDEQFFLVHEESDFCLRVAQAGYALGVLNLGLVWHQQSQSFRRSGQFKQRYYDARNLYLLLRRHATGQGRRSWWGSWTAYLRYLYHRFTLEREAGQPASADAVLAGLHDAVVGHFGIWRERRRLSVPVLRSVFTTVHALKRRAPVGSGT
jgi:hypothetical protein